MVEGEVEVVEVAVVGKMIEVGGEGEGGEVALEDLETGSRRAVDEEVAVEEGGMMVLETGRADKAGETRGLLRETIENLRGGVTGVTRSATETEKRGGERGRADGGRRHCLPTCRLPSIPTRRRSRRGKKTSRRRNSLLMPMERAEKSRIKVFRSRRGRRCLLQGRLTLLLLTSRCKRIQQAMQLEINSKQVAMDMVNISRKAGRLQA